MMPTAAFVVMIVMMFTAALMIVFVVVFATTLAILMMMPIATVATAPTAVVLMCHFFQFFWANLFNTFYLSREVQNLTS